MMTTNICGRLIKQEGCNSEEMIISMYELEPKQVKSEDIDVVYHDLKSESFLEEVREASHCEVCGVGLLSPTDDFFNPDYSKLCFNCQCKNGSSNGMQGEYMSVDLKQPSSDPVISLFRTQEETIVGKEVEIIDENISSMSSEKDCAVVEHKISHETEEITQILSSGHYSNSVKGSRIQEENEDWSKNFNEKTDVKSVKNNHTGKIPLYEKNHTDKKLYQCNICSKSFNQYYGLNRHKNIHTGKKPYQCKMCSKSYMDSGALRKHEKFHTGEKQFHCEICSKCFTRKSSLEWHEQFHTGERPFLCKICFKSYTTKDYLTRHEKIHTGGKPYWCEICSKSFFQRKMLKIHEMIHSCKTLYHCKICSKSFTQSCNLKTHQKIHTGEKPYICKICSKSFTQKASLKKHEKIHIGKIPYQCKICSKTFAGSIYLKKHEKIHTVHSLNVTN